MSDALLTAPSMLIDLFVRSTLIVAVASIVTALFRQIGIAATVRHAVWLTAIAAVATLPLLVTLAPRLVILVPPALTTWLGAPDLSTPGAHPSAFASAAPWVCTLYALGVVALFARLLAACITLARLWRGARPETVDDAPGASLAHVRITDAAIVPLTWGRRILLPARAEHWTPARWRDVLLHELCHMRRGDSLTQMLAGCVRALFWFSPGVWHAVHRLRVEQEHACDACVVAEGAEPLVYAQTLLDVAADQHAPAIGMGVSAAMAQASDLERRVHAIVTPPSRAAGASLSGAIAGAFALAAAVLIMAAQPVDAARVLPPLAPMSTTLEPLTSTLSPLPIPGWCPRE